MNTEQYERLVKSAETIRTKTAEFHRVATDALTTAQKVLDNSVAQFLDGVEQGVQDAKRRYESAGNTWGEATDNPRNSDRVEDQIQDIVNRFRESYGKTSKGASDENPLKTVQDLVNEIFNPKPKDDDGTV